MVGNLAGGWQVCSLDSSESFKGSRNQVLNHICHLVPTVTLHRSWNMKNWSQKARNRWLCIPHPGYWEKVSMDRVLTPWNLREKSQQGHPLPISSLTRYIYQHKDNPYQLQHIHYVVMVPVPLLLRNLCVGVPRVHSHYLITLRYELHLASDLVCHQSWCGMLIRLVFET